jgi:hypothetical protein
MQRGNFVREELPTRPMAFSSLGHIRPYRSIRMGALASPDTAPLTPSPAKGNCVAGRAGKGSELALVKRHLGQTLLQKSWLPNPEVRSRGCASLTRSEGRKRKFMMCRTANLAPGGATCTQLAATLVPLATQVASLPEIISRKETDHEHR